MGYEELTPDDLATLYLKKPEERERIGQHVAGLNEYQQSYFRHLIEGQEVLPFQRYAANNLHAKRDGHVLWSDLYSFDSLVWHYQQQKEDLIKNSPAPNLSLFIDRAIANATAARTKLIESYNESGSVDDDDRYSLYVGEYDQFISFLEKERAAQEGENEAEPTRYRAEITADDKQAGNTVTPGKPMFRADAIEQILSIISGYFDRGTELQLKKLLQEGEDLASPLLFKANGNRLADAFKQMYMCHIITGCQKIELESWIKRNFMFLHRGEQLRFTDKYLNDLISTNTKHCKNPLLIAEREKEGFKLRPLKQNVKKSDNF